MTRLLTGQRTPSRGRDAIRDGLRTAPAHLPSRWDRALVWFMRALALLWLAKGLGAWGMILGAGSPSPSFDVRSTGFQATTIYFAVLDLVAAVGLWLASTWGGVMWLLTTVSYLILALLFPGVLDAGLISIAISGALIAAYLVLSWLAARES